MVTKAYFERWFGFQRMVTFKRIIITESPTIYPGGYHWPETKYTMRLRAGQRLGILWWVNHLLTPPKRFHHLQVRSVMEYSLLAWMNADSTPLKELNIMQNIAAILIDIPFTTIHSFHHRHTVGTVCTMYWMPCSNLDSIFQTYDLEELGKQKHGNTTTWKLSSKPHTLLTEKHITIPSPLLDLNTLVNSFENMPTPQEQQQFTMAAHPSQGEIWN